MLSQISKWGNSHGIRLSRDVLELAGMKTGDLVTIASAEGKITIKKHFRHRTLEERAANLEERPQPGDLEQGSLIELEPEKERMCVLSRTLFNRSGRCVACPVVDDAAENVLHLEIGENLFYGVALCGQLRTLELANCRYRKLGRLPYGKIQDLTDAARAIFDS